MIEIKGIKYEEIPQHQPMRMSKTAMELIAMASMFYTPYMGYGNGNSQPKEKLKIDIVKEFELIQDKKSNLSRSEREWVVKIFNQKYRQVI